ncbi:MAG: hypothetical protein KKE17_06860 [Proteobacteria bacterium]|nr:hypothetical protein [Pseudomonadota bacterium]MBU1709708.1 hypothetical protein [Pseudomonadota bacterium]
MRCPKCGFISFDHLTSCSKCSRDLTQIAEELQGTSLESDLSLFLGSVTGTLPDEDAFESSAETFAADDEATMFDLETADEDEGISLTLDDESDEEALSLEADDSSDAAGPLAIEDEITLDMAETPIDLSGIEEEAPSPPDQMESLLAEAGEYQEAQNGEIAFNLGEIDLSDLAPIDEDSAEETLAETGDEPVLEIDSDELVFESGPETDEKPSLKLMSEEGDTVIMKVPVIEEPPAKERDSDEAVLDLDDMMMDIGSHDDTGPTLDLSDDNDTMETSRGTGDAADDLMLDLEDVSGATEEEPFDLGDLELTLESEDDK